MTGAAAGKTRTKRVTGPKEKRGDGSARAGTDWCWLELGTGSTLATKGTGTRSPSKTHRQGSLGPNGPKLSDGGKKSKELGADATPPFAGARG